MVRGVLLLLPSLALAAPLAAEAQAARPVSRIGFLSGGSPVSNTSIVEGFRQGMRDRGYVEGENIIIDARYVEGEYDRLTGLVAELVGLKVDVIVTVGTPATRAVLSSKPRAYFPSCLCCPAISWRPDSSPASRALVKTLRA